MLMFDRFAASTRASVRKTTPLLVAALVATLTLVPLSRPADAMQIQTIKSPGGIEAWLVEEHGNPAMALKFSFEGGSAQDPAGKEGIANFMTAMMDEGAGDLTSEQFQDRMETLAMRMNFDDSKDGFYGNFETLTVNRDKSAELLKLAINKPTFETAAMDRIRKQLLAGLVYAARDPEKAASKAWNTTAYGTHPYGRPAQGSEATIAKIASADLASFRTKTFAKSNLKIVAVGDINAADLGKLIDNVFGALPDKPELTAVTPAKMAAGTEQFVEMDVPQSVAVFGAPAMARKDPDFMTGFVLNQLVGGGGFASRLMEEVREKRGLAYSVYSYILPMKQSSLLTGGVATKTTAMAESLSVIKAEFKRIADEGPSEVELANAKSYLTGSYALRFDSNSKIASQLLGLQEEGFGADYIEKRNGLIEAVTMADAKRVAKTLFDPTKLVITTVGKPATAQPATPATKG
jgi:zinc protease